MPCGTIVASTSRRGRRLVVTLLLSLWLGLGGLAGIAASATAASAQAGGIVVITPESSGPGDTVIIYGRELGTRTYAVELGDDVLVDSVTTNDSGSFAETVTLPGTFDPALLDELTLTDPTTNNRPPVTPTVLTADDVDAAIANLPEPEPELEPEPEPEREGEASQAGADRSEPEVELRTNPLWPALALGQLPVTGLLLWREFSRRTSTASRSSGSSRRRRGRSSVPTSSPGRSGAESSKSAAVSDADVAQRRHAAGKVSEQRRDLGNITAWEGAAPDPAALARERGLTRSAHHDRSAADAPNNPAPFLEEDFPPEVGSSPNGSDSTELETEEFAHEELDTGRPFDDDDVDLDERAPVRQPEGSDGEATVTGDEADADQKDSWWR